MKKQRIAPIPTPTFDGLKFQTDSGGLPTAETVESAVSALTEKKSPETKKTTEKTVVKPSRKAGRPLKMNAAGRSVYNTMVQKSLIKDIKRIAVEEEVTVADLIEEALQMFVDSRKKSVK